VICPRDNGSGKANARRANGQDTSPETTAREHRWFTSVSCGRSFSVRLDYGDCTGCAPVTMAISGDGGDQNAWFTTQGTPGWDASQPPQDVGGKLSMTQGKCGLPVRLFRNGLQGYGVEMNPSHFNGKRIALVMDVQGREVVLRGRTVVHRDRKDRWVLEVIVTGDDESTAGDPVFLIAEDRWVQSISDGLAMGCDYCLNLNAMSVAAT
jgi:hypothetical protein